jgi:hypothetical protein
MAMPATRLSRQRVPGIDGLNRSEFNRRSAARHREDVADDPQHGDCTW